MPSKTILISLVAGLLCLGGCSHSDDADSSPLPAQDSATRVQQATQNVESSSMTPEQKKAAEDYLKQGAIGAAERKKSAQQGGAPK